MHDLQQMKCNHFASRHRLNPTSHTMGLPNGYRPSKLLPFCLVAFALKIYKCHTVILTLLNVIVKLRVLDIVITALQIHLRSMAASRKVLAGLPIGQRICNSESKRIPLYVPASKWCCQFRTLVCRASSGKYIYIYVVVDV